MDGLLYHESPLGRWLQENGGSLHDKLIWRKEPNGHRLEATEDISATSKLVSLPYELAISPSTVRKHLGASASAGLNDHQLMVFYLLLHNSCLKRDDIPNFLKHMEYVRTLPRPAQMRTASWFNDAERTLVAGSNLGPAIVDRESLWKTEYENFQASESRLEGFKLSQFTWHDYLWACTILSSRAFPSYLLDGDRPNATQVLLPCVDAFNHQTGQAVTWFSDHQQKAMQLIIDAPISAGQEVCNNYGAKPNDELLLGYGFVLRYNPGDFVSLRMGTKGDSVPVKLLAKLEIPLTNTHYIRVSATELPAELLAQLRVLIADEEELATLQRQVDTDGSHEEGGNGADWRDVLKFISWPDELEMLEQLGAMLEAKSAGLNAALQRAQEHESTQRSLKRRKTENMPREPEVRSDCLEMILVYLEGQVKIMSLCMQWHEQLFKDTVQRARDAGFDMESEEESDSEASEDDEDDA